MFLQTYNKEQLRFEVTIIIVKYLLNMQKSIKIYSFYI